MPLLRTRTRYPREGLRCSFSSTRRSGECYALIATVMIASFVMADSDGTSTSRPAQAAGNEGTVCCPSLYHGEWHAPFDKLNHNAGVGLYNPRQ